MKYTLLIVFLCSALISKAIIIHPYVGISMTKGKLYNGFTGTGSNSIGGLRLEYELPAGLQLGIGMDVQNLAYNDNVPSVWTANYTKVTVGAPAYSLYLHAGYRIRIAKFSVIPGLSIGGAYAKGEHTEDPMIYNLSNSIGYLVGGNLGLEYGFKRLAVHAEFMPRYYHQRFQSSNGHLALLNYPVTLGVAIML
jgi:hypothetical protein